MILALAEAINILFSPDQLEPSQQAVGQQPPLSVYAYIVSKTVCQPCVRPLMLQTRKKMAWKFFTPEKAVTHYRTC